MISRNGIFPTIVVSSDVCDYCDYCDYRNVEIRVRPEVLLKWRWIRSDFDANENVVHHLLYKSYFHLTKEGTGCYENH